MILTKSMQAINKKKNFINTSSFFTYFAIQFYRWINKTW